MTTLIHDLVEVRLIANNNGSLDVYIRSENTSNRTECNWYHKNYSDWESMDQIYNNLRNEDFENWPERRPS